ncbi:chromate resistance protein ChrB domain-containing protein [Roseibium sp.]|uniref:chromate resistance protein ChrB domain-containing protein n=1 Tax=Roseibium sp. TaxID=1936156 RepID=UPI003BAD830F
MPSLNSISVSQLSRLVGTPDAPVILDVRIDEDFAADPGLIPSSFRQPFRSVDDLAGRLQGRRVVVACWKGLKLSEGVAAILRASGIHAEFLEGGCTGWREAGLPMVPAASLPGRNSEGQTVWVTRHRPKIDRIACPWLIRRFVDPSARFLFVSPAQVDAVAEKFGATPFDVENAFWSHRDDRCSFDTMLEEFQLQSAPLSRLATIVRAADTNRHDLAPEAAGLLAASLGLSRMYKDDLRQLEAGMGLYDAFYRWARDATDEGHDWPTTGGRG